MKDDKEKNKGKQGNAATNASYDKDAEKIKGSSTTSQNSTTSPSLSGGGGSQSKPGRGWHGDAEGHAKAGSQSHKNSGNKKA